MGFHFYAYPRAPEPGLGQVLRGAPNVPLSPTQAPKIAPVFALPEIVKPKKRPPNGGGLKEEVLER